MHGRTALKVLIDEFAYLVGLVVMIVKNLLLMFHDRSRTLSQADRRSKQAYFHTENENTDTVIIESLNNSAFYQDEYIFNIIANVCPTPMRHHY